MKHMDEQWIDLIVKQEQLEKKEEWQASLSSESIKKSIQAGHLVWGDEVISFEKKEVVPGQVFLSVPASFVLLPEEYARIKYPAGRRPEIIYTDETLEVNLTVNLTENKMVNDEMETFVKDLSFMLKRMQPNARWMEEGVRQVGDRQMGFYEFIVPVLDGAMYNGVFFIEWEGKGLFFGLNCMERHQEKWRLIAHGIMDSLQVTQQEQRGEQ